MADGVTFWLDNKNATGLKVASLGDQVLVTYRNRYYVVADGAALVKSGKAVRYALTTLPAAWKKELTGGPAAVSVAASTSPPDAVSPPVTRKAASNKRSESIPMPEPAPVASAPPVAEKSQRPSRKAPKPEPQAAPAQTAQTTVPVECPYCQQKKEIPVEKGQSGKPFFQNCPKCQADFAVRFVSVTTFKAQVAGFK